MNKGPTDKNKKTISSMELGHSLWAEQLNCVTSVVSQFTQFLMRNTCSIHPSAEEETRSESRDLPRFKTD